MKEDHKEKYFIEMCKICSYDFKCVVDHMIFNKKYSLFL